MWIISRSSMTLQEVLIMAYMNVLNIGWGGSSTTRQHGDVPGGNACVARSLFGTPLDTASATSSALRNFGERRLCHG